MSTNASLRVLRRLFAATFVLGIAHTAIAQPLLVPGDEHVERQQATSQSDGEPGYLGLITDDRQNQGQGVRVVRVVDGTPAAKAGFRVDDMIVAIDGQATGSLDDMAAQLKPHGAKDKVRFEVRRGDATETIEVTLGRRPPMDQRPFEFGRIPERLPEPNGDAAPLDLPGARATARSVPRDAAPGAERRQLLGIRSAPVSEDIRQRHGLPSQSGARVVSRVVGSPADQAGLPLDSVIVAVDGQSVESPADLARLIAAAGPGKQVELTYFSNGQQRQSTVTLAPLGQPSLPADGPLGERPMFPRTFDRPAAPDISTADRIDQLERRIRELEERVQQLERMTRN